jgi:frataxin
MNESDFHCFADAMLATLEDVLEEADQAGFIDLEAADSTLTVTLADKKQFVLSKHAPTRQLWLSSPFSGAHHFSYDAAKQDWLLADGKSLKALLDSELAHVINP